MSPTPYNNAFKEESNLPKFDFSHHRAAGMAFLPQDNRLILASIAPSIPGARVPRCRTRLHSAWLLSINGTPVYTLAEVHQVFHNLSLSRPALCILLFAHPEISNGLSNKGLPLLRCNQIPQLSIDQLSNHWTSTLHPPPDLPKAPSWDIVINGNVWNVVTKVMKLTQGKLMKQDDWPIGTNLNTSNLTSMTNSLCSGTQLLRKMNQLYFTLFGRMWLRNLMGARKLDVFVTGLLIPARYGSLTTHMQTASTELARASSM